jgi:hypothetical protein
MITEPEPSPSDHVALGSDTQYCPRCGHHRAGQLRLCGYCRFDLDAPVRAEAASLEPSTPTVRLVPPDEPLASGTGPKGGRKRWLLLGPIAAL